MSQPAPSLRYAPVKQLQSKTTALTPLQDRFVAAYITNGGNASEAVKAAGSRTKHPGSMGSQMLRKPHVRQAIRDALHEGLNTRLIVKAMKRLDHLVDAAESEHVQLGATVKILEMAGMSEAQSTPSGFRGVVLMDFRSPEQRQRDGQDPRDPSHDVQRDAGGQKPAVPTSTTPSTPPTVSRIIDAEYEDVS